MNKQDGLPVEDAVFKPSFNGAILEDLEEVFKAIAAVSGELVERKRSVKKTSMVSYNIHCQMVEDIKLAVNFYLLTGRIRRKTFQEGK